MSNAQTIQARRATVKLSIDGHDASSEINPSLLSFSYTDNISGKADEIQITLQDRDHKWNGAWKIEKGQEVTASIELKDWFEVNESLSLTCGSFKVDTVSVSGPPDIFTVKAVTSDLTSALRDTTKTRAWENQSLEGIASEIASEHDLQLYYDGETYTMQRQDQREEADLPFVERIAKERAMETKVHDGKLVMFDSIASEKQSPSVTLQRSGDTVLKYNFSENSSKTAYTKAEVEYTDTQTGTTHTATATSQDAETATTGDDKVLRLNRRVESSSDAMRLADSELHNANKGESKARLSLMGNPKLYAGTTVSLADFGDFSGTFLIEKVTHKLGGSSGYTTDIECRKCSASPNVLSSSGSVPLADVAAKESGLNAGSELGDAGNALEQVDSVINQFVPSEQTLNQMQERFAVMFEEIKKRLGLQFDLSDLEQLLLCLPDIAANMSANADNSDDAIGWDYLQSMFQRWFSSPAGISKEKNEPMWISWTWVMSYVNAQLAYSRFTLPEPALTATNHIYDTLALDTLAKILCNNDYMVNGVDIPFDFIGSDWQKWEDYYHTHIGVSGIAFGIDGNVAALDSFSLRALASGNVESLGNNKFRIIVKNIAVFAHDVFNFEESDGLFSNYLGAWSCDELNVLVSAQGKNSYTELENEIFRNFNSTYGYGSDFLVLSAPNLVANFKEVSYEYTCTQDSQ